MPPTSRELLFAAGFSSEQAAAILSAIHHELAKLQPATAPSAAPSPSESTGRPLPGELRLLKSELSAVIHTIGRVQRALENP